MLLNVIPISSKMTKTPSGSFERAAEGRSKVKKNVSHMLTDSLSADVHFVDTANELTSRTKHKGRSASSLKFTPTHGLKVEPLRGELVKPQTV